MGKEELHICLICVEIFAWGKYGGFGRATRLIGRELVKRGVRVTAVVPRRQDQKPEEILDGIRVLSFGKTDMGEQYRLYKEIDADVYHSEEPSFGTFLAQQAMPHKKHMITFRDPRRISDWLTEFRLPSLSRAQVLMNILYEDNFLVHQHSRTLWEFTRPAARSDAHTQAVITICAIICHADMRTSQGRLVENISGT